LISADQIKRIAREERLAAGVVEKDYVLTWLLKGIYLVNSNLRDNFVLKGGTAIRKAYFPQTWRFSEDLDFTVVEALEPEEIKAAMQEVLETLRVESGINYSFESFHPTVGSIIANVQFVGPLNFTNRIKHDISLKEKWCCSLNAALSGPTIRICQSLRFYLILSTRYLQRRSEALCKGDTRATIMTCGDC
jgi:hypothetical protein